MDFDFNPEDLETISEEEYLSGSKNAPAFDITDNSQFETISEEEYLNAPSKPKLDVKKLNQSILDYKGDDPREMRHLNREWVFGAKFY